MAKLLKLRRGSTSGHSTFTGAEGEVTIDTTKKTAVVHDGTTQSGLPLARENMNNVSSADIAGRLADDAIATSKIGAGALPTDVTVASANIVDGSIVNADVNASAAIAGTKISPDFGSQNIATTGNASIGGTNLNMSSAYIDFSGSISTPTTAAAIYRPADNSLAISTGNNERLLVNNNGATVNGNITVTGTVDGVDVATRDTLFGGLTSSSGVLTDGVTATTQSAGDASTKVATTAYTDTAISNLVDSSPSALNTLNELAAALNDDANFSTTVTNSIATKMPTAGGVFVGDVTFDGAATGRDIVFDRSAESFKFSDDAKAVFGSGDDLQIYHDGTDNLLVASNGSIKSSAAGHFINNADNSHNFIRCENVSSNNLVSLHFNNGKKLETTNTGVSVTGALVATGNVTAFSDSRLKTEIHTIKDPLEKVGRLRGVTFKWLHTDKPSSGVIAQEVQEVFPELVEATTHEGKEVLSVDYGKLVGVLIESIKELKAELEAHKAECAKQHGGE